MALLSMNSEGAVLDWGALYLRQELGADIATAGFAFAVFAGAMAMMRFLGDGVRNRFGAVTTLRVSSLIAAAGMLVAGLSPDAVAGDRRLRGLRARHRQHGADPVFGGRQPARHVVRAPA